MDKVELSENDILMLRKEVRPYLTDKRYAHTLSVESEADRLGRIYLPGECNRLRSAALLHDITKRIDAEHQLNLLKEFDIIPSNYSDCSPEILHAYTGAVFAERNFREYVDGEIISAIRWHTTGHDGMSLFETLICFADFIEQGRSYQGCTDVRNGFYGSISEGGNKYEILCDSMIRMFDMTISHLKEKKSDIDENTVLAREYFERYPFSL